jgi:hypothetical protein
MVHLYNKYSGGVDRRNAYVSRHESKLKRFQKWWHNVFDRLFETSLLNSYLIFSFVQPDSLDKNHGIFKVLKLFLVFQEFRVNLMNQMIQRSRCYNDGLSEKRISISQVTQITHVFIKGVE